MLAVLESANVGFWIELEVGGRFARGRPVHVFRVVRSDDPDGPRYALKRLKNLRRRDRFGREIVACQKLDHPNIVRIVAHEADSKGRPFIVIEYCPGGTLADRKPPLGSVLDVSHYFQANLPRRRPRPRERSDPS